MKLQVFIWLLILNETDRESLFKLRHVTHTHSVFQWKKGML